MISAAAGAGKTSVLVERIINRLKDPKQPLDIDRLLVVTFTNAAAAQMREQIGRALAQELTRQPGSGHLRRQLTLLNYSAIATLHSFCLEVMRQQFYRLELDPNFRVADDGEANLLQLEVLEDLLEAKYQEAGAEDLNAFLNLVDCYGGERNDAGLSELVLSLYLFSRSHPWPEYWLRQAAANFSFAADYTIDDFEWAPLLKQSMALELQDGSRKLEQALQLCQKPQAPQTYLDNLHADLELLQDLVRACDRSWPELFEAFQGAEFGRLKPVSKKEKDTVDSFLQEQIKQLRDEVKTLVKNLKETYFAQEPEQQLKDLRQAAPLLNSLVDLVLKFSARFQREKQRRGLVDFSDLEHYCLRILLEEGSEPGRLIPSAVALELRERFTEVLVDEYQDINTVQEAILQLVSRQTPEAAADPRRLPDKSAGRLADALGDKLEDKTEERPGEGESGLSEELGLPEELELPQNSVPPNLFMVGDVKQSIYRFRLADPGLFLARYHRFSKEPGTRERRINLRENFRSSPSIVDGVNFFFRQIMTVYVGEMAYDTEAELVCGLSRPVEAGPDPEAGARLSPEIELYLIDRQKETPDNQAQSAEDEGSTAAEPFGEAGFAASVGEAGDSASAPGSALAPAPAAEPDFIEEVLDTAELEARVTAQRIRQMVEQEQLIWDHKLGQYRPVRYGDIAVLMRATRGVANVYLTEFRKMGIPAYAELGTGYFAAGEVEIMLALLQIIDNPLQDIPLAAVLRSPIVGLSAEEMAQIRVAGGTGRSYYETLVAAANAATVNPSDALDVSDTSTPSAAIATATNALDDVLNASDSSDVSAAVAASAETAVSKASDDTSDAPDLADTDAVSVLPQQTLRKIQTFLEALPKWRTLARRERLTTLLWEIWQQTGFFDYVGGMPGGAQRQANLRLLQTWAGEYESTAFRGLFHFLRFVERIRETGGDRGAARTLSENEDVVRIMSIHKSKGLEFPVVWVTGLGRQFNLMDLRGLVLTHKDFGFGPQLVDPADSISYPTLAKLALQYRIKLETLAEEIRLLYVAMTRAREKLYLLGTTENLARKASTWCQTAQTTAPTLPEAALARARCYLDWVVPALARHQQGQVLWETAGQAWNPDFGFEDTAPFKLWIIGPREIDQLADLSPLDQEELWGKIRAGQPLESGEMSAEIRRRLHWQYAFPAVAGKSTKLTVSEIKRLFEPLPAEELEEPPAETIPALRDTFETRLLELKKPVFLNQPRFIQEKQGLSPAERGSAVHLVMQNLNLQGPLDEKSIAAQITCFVAKEMLTPEQAQAVEPTAIAGFFASPLGQRILQAPRVYRELPFSMAVPAGQVYADLGKDSPEQVMVQGVIDCLVEEEDGFLLIDYKTDWLGGPGRIEELTQRYQWQLWFYAQAAERIFKRPVKELYLYFLAGGVAQTVSRESLGTEDQDLA